MSKTTVINTDVHKRKLLTAILLTLILVVPATFLITYTVYGNPGAAVDEAIWEPGTQVGEASYIIWKDGSTYYAKNGTIGAIQYSGTNASQIIQNGYDALNGTYPQEITLLGEITITNTIFPSSYSILNIRGTLKLADGANTNAISLNSVTDVKIINGIIDGNRLQQSGTSSAIDISNSDRNIIQNVRIKSFLNNSIDLYSGSDENLIIGNRIEDTLGDAITLGTTARKNRIIGNEIMNMGTTSTGISILGFDNILSNNRIEQCRDGILINTTSALNTLVVGNHISSNNRYGIYLETTYKITVTGNLVANNANNNIYLKSATQTSIMGNIVTGSTAQSGISLYISNRNNIVGNTIQDNYRHGVVLQSSDNNTIGQNQIANNAQDGSQGNYDGILLTNSEGNVLTGNKSHDDQATKTQGWGIQESGTSNYNTIVSCDTRENYVGGIKILGANTKVNLSWNGTSWIA